VTAPIINNVPWEHFLFRRERTLQVAIESVMVLTAALHDSEHRRLGVGVSVRPDAVLAGLLKLIGELAGTETPMLANELQTIYVAPGPLADILRATS
jgi:hypothetical protein